MFKKSMTATEAWFNLLDMVMALGKNVSPRGEETKELIANQSIIDMNFPVVLAPGRNISYNFMFAEAWWILSGRKDVASIKPYAPSIEKFSDNGIDFAGAYGPAFVDQIPYVINVLCDDPYSRQAILTIWNRNPAKSKDIPCTISLQFIIRDGTLDCVATMRSSDVWIGFIYDVFNFSCMAHIVAAELNGTGKKVALGNLFLTAGSQHLYERTFKKAVNVLNNQSSLVQGKEHAALRAVNHIFTQNNYSDAIKALDEVKDYEFR